MASPTTGAADDADVPAKPMPTAKAVASKIARILYLRLTFQSDQKVKAYYSRLQLAQPFSIELGISVGSLIYRRCSVGACDWLIRRYCAQWEVCGRAESTNSDGLFGHVDPHLEGWEAGRFPGGAAITWPLSAGA
jgi:hypothetical protein